MKLFSAGSWRWIFGITGVLIVLVTLLYADYLADRLATIEENYIGVYSMAMDKINDVSDRDDQSCDYTFEQYIVENNTTVPAIMVDANDSLLFIANFPRIAEGAVSVEDTTYLRNRLNEWKKAGTKPISSFGNTIYLGRSRLLDQLRYYFPILQFLLIGGFIVLGYFGINAARKAEQNRVWVGLAKETAHQLGTPISAIIGWLEHLRSTYQGKEDIEMVADEMTKDVNRLEMVANRFSKIGADPELKTVNIYDQLWVNHEYMAVRAPRKVQLYFPEPASHEPILLQINPLLFDWVIENLLRNAIDALEGKGEIYAEVVENPESVTIDITDTGKGIAPGKHKAVFNPGYTTKQRGWGLGLSLAKRIIERYHKGKIFVSRSEPGVGTTFSIVLPKN